MPSSRHHCGRFSGLSAAEMSVTQDLHIPGRVWWLGGLFAAELVLIVLAFQVLAPIECRLTEIETACRGLRGAMVRVMCLVALLAVYLWARPSARAGFMAMVAAHGGGWGWAGLHGAGLVLALAPLVLIAPEALNQRFATVFVALATGGALSLAGGVFWLAAPRDWRTWLRGRTGLLALLGLVATVLPDIATALGPLWYWRVLTETTFAAVALMLLPFAGTLVIDPARLVIGTGDFAVSVAASCSGIEGFALITAFMAVYGWMFRDSLRLGRYWGVALPLALLASWTLNILRIAALVMIGDRVSPELAQNGFHSFAGWLFFILLAFGVLVAADRWTWLRRDMAVRAARPRLAEDDIAARIVPFIVFMVSGVIVQAFWTVPALGFPLQAGMMALALWWVRRPLAACLARPDMVAVIAGLAVGAGWVLLAPPPSGPPAEATARALAALSPALFGLWVMVRLFGTSVLVPVVEELFFRGYVQARLDRSTLGSRALAIAVSAGLFGLLHQRWLDGALAGLVFSLVFLRRGRLVDAIWAHGAANAGVAAVAAWRGDWSLI